MRKKIEFEWELILLTAGSETSRAQVIGGWLVMVIIQNTKAPPASMVFVSDPEHQWQILKPVVESKVVIPESQF